MQLFIKSKRNHFEAVGEFDVKNRKFTILKGARVSQEVSSSTKFRGAKTVVSLRADCVKNGITTKNITFKSASSAANFITGRSTNGLLVWKNKDSKKLGTIIKKA